LTNGNKMKAIDLPHSTHV